MYKEIARFRIRQWDVSEDNIVCAAQPYLPTLPSSFHKKKFSWRIIDLGIARKSNGGIAMLESDYEDCVAGLKDRLKERTQ